MEDLFIDLANSEWYDGRGNREDRLADPTWQAELLRSWGFPRAHLDGDTLRRLGHLRASIRSIVEDLHRGNGPGDAEVSALNRVLAAHPARLQLIRQEDTLTLQRAVPPRPSGQAIVGEIAVSAAQFLTTGELDRLKRCDNPGCRWVFYDETKNRNRRWCGGTCGNLDKVRRFRERRRSTR